MERTYIFTEDRSIAIVGLIICIKDLAFGWLLWSRFHAMWPIAVVLVFSFALLAVVHRISCARRE